MGWENILLSIEKVVILWLVGFCLVGGIAIPIITSLFRLESAVVAPWKQAFFTVTVDILEMCVGLGILKACVMKYKPIERGLFPVRIAGKWPLVVMAASMCFPFVQHVANFSEVAVPVKQSLDLLPREIMSMSLLELVSNRIAIDSRCH